jgi:hypothetical protein
MHNARFFQDFCGAKQFVCILTGRVVFERPLVNDQLKAIWSKIQAGLVAFKNREERGCATSGDISDCAFFQGGHR